MQENSSGGFEIVDKMTTVTGEVILGEIIQLI